MATISPTPYQARCLLIPEAWNMLLAGGRGGGKTTGVAQIVLRHVEQYGAAARPLIVRETYKAMAELEDTVEGLLIDAYGRVNRNRAEHTIRLPNGAIIEFGQLDSSTAYKKFQGRSFTLLIIEEIGALKELRWIELLKSNLRSPDGIPLRVVATANPGGIQHALLHQRYITAAKAWHPFTVADETWVCCPSTLKDNPHLDHADYSRKLRAACGSDEALAKAWIEGDWNIARGAMFADVIDQGQQMLLPIDPIHVTWQFKGWRTFISLDWGSAAPSVAYICKVAPSDAFIGQQRYPKGSLLLLDELASCDFASGDYNRGLHWPASVLAERLSELCQHWQMLAVEGVGDDAAGIEDSLLQFLRGFHIYLQKPQKGRISGWSRMREMLHASKMRTGLPGLFVSSRCRYWWATVPYLPRDEYHPDDVETSAPDHGADAARYAVMHATTSGITQGRVIYS